MVFLNPYYPPSEMVSFYRDPKAMAQANPRLATYYENLEGSRTEKFFDKSLDRLKRYLSQDGASLLDIACGNGYFLSRAKQKGWQVRGLDSSPESSRLVWGNLHVSVDVSEVEHYQSNEQFDCISLWDFIEHVPDPKTLLEKAESLLKPGGILLIATPDHFSLINFLADRIHLLSLGMIQKPLEILFVPEHILYFTDQTLKRLVEECDFEIVDTMKTGTDIDRYRTSWIFNATAKILLLASRWLCWQNRIVIFARKRNKG